MARIKNLRAFQARCNVVDFCLMFERRFKKMNILTEKGTVVPYIPFKYTGEESVEFIPERHDHESYDACMEYLCESVHCNPVT